MTYLKPLSAHRSVRAMEVNHISEDILNEAPSIEDALDAFEAFCYEVEARPLLAAWGTYFDVTFMKSFYKKLGRKWKFSYRCLDLKSIAIWEMSKRGKLATGGVDTFLEFAGLEFEGKPHDALDDIRNTIRIIQAL